MKSTTSHVRLHPVEWCVGLFFPQGTVGREREVELNEALGL